MSYSPQSRRESDAAVQLTLYPCVCVYIYTPRHLGCFCVLAIVNTAAMNIGGQASFQIRIFMFSRYMLRSGISGSYSSSTFSFLRKLILFSIESPYVF